MVQLIQFFQVEADSNHRMVFPRPVTYRIGGNKGSVGQYGQSRILSRFPGMKQFYPVLPFPAVNQILIGSNPSPKMSF